MKSLMQKIWTSRFWWLALVLGIAAVNYLASVFHSRLDLTAEKRYTISKATKKLISGLDEQVDITVYLSGDLPAGFKKLANSTKELLSEFKEYGKASIQYRFDRPDDQMADSLTRMGLSPTNVRARIKEGEGEEQRLVYPGALIGYKGRTMVVDLLKGQSAVDGINSLNNAEALLEYKFASTIEKISTDSVPLVGYLIGNGEPVDYSVYDAINTLKANYAFRIVNVDSVNIIPPVFSCLVMVKPVQSFTEQQKLKIDQYIMHGGKMIWMIDNLYAELDSLQHNTAGKFVAYDRNLNLTDQLFKYGVRINPDLVQDSRCDQVPLVVGDMGDKPQMQLIPWVYFPLLSGTSGHPVAKNLGDVLSIFPNSIDTVKAPGITKTVLLSTGANSRILSTPAIVSWESVKTEEDLKTFTRSNIPVAMLLEGKFSSVFSNRISQSLADTLANIYRQPFLPACLQETKIIVIADGDLATNPVSEKNGPMPMGMNPYSEYQYANKEFFMNAVEYMVNNSGILETRSKDYTLRLLDKKKSEEDRTFWQLINLAVPVLLIILFGWMYQVWRKNKYQGTNKKV
jgi:ABC-2 type transport system permease protein